MPFTTQNMNIQESDLERENNDYNFRFLPKPARGRKLFRPVKPVNLAAKNSRFITELEMHAWFKAKAEQRKHLDEDGKRAHARRMENSCKKKTRLRR